MARRPKAPCVPEVEPEGLSPQQREIWRLAKEQKTVNEIAAELGVGQRTVRKQLERLRKAIMTTRDVNTKSRSVSHAHWSEKELRGQDEMVRTVLTSDSLSLQARAEILSQTGHFSDRALAEHLGTTYGAVRVMRTRMHKAAAKGKVVRGMATPDEIAALSPKPTENHPVLANLVYEVYVRHGDSWSPDAWEARRLLAALGGGGPQVRRVAFTDRARTLKRLLAEQKQLMKLVGKNVYWLVKDVIEREFTLIDAGILKPKRKGSWDAVRAVLKARFLALSDRKVSINEVNQEEGLPVYELDCDWYDIAAVVREMPGLYLVARADPVEPGGRAAAGRLESWHPEEGRAVLATDRGQMVLECAAAAVRHGGRLWRADDPRVAQPGDAVEVVGSCLVVRSRGPRVVVLPEPEVVRLAAWFIAGKDCWVKVWHATPEGEDAYKKWRCFLPAAANVMLVDVPRLDADHAVDVYEYDKGGNPIEGAVRVRRHGERYRVLTGKTRVAEAVARGIDRIPAVVEQPLV